jgi:hypothetical protein
LSWSLPLTLPHLTQPLLLLLNGLPHLWRRDNGLVRVVVWSVELRRLVLRSTALPCQWLLLLGLELCCKLWRWLLLRLGVRLLGPLLLVLVLLMLILLVLVHLRSWCLLGLGLRVLGTLLLLLRLLPLLNRDHHHVLWQLSPGRWKLRRRNRLVRLKLWGKDQ